MPVHPQTRSSVLALSWLGFLSGIVEKMGWKRERGKEVRAAQLQQVFLIQGPSSCLSPRALTLKWARQMQIREEPLDLLSYWPRAHLFNKYLRCITVCQRLATPWEDNGGQGRCLSAAFTCSQSSTRDRQTTRLLQRSVKVIGEVGGLWELTGERDLTQSQAGEGGLPWGKNVQWKNWKGNLGAAKEGIFEKWGRKQADIWGTEINSVELVERGWGRGKRAKQCEAGASS